MKKGIKIAICIVLPFIILRACSSIIKISDDSSKTSDSNATMVSASTYIPTVQEKTLCDDSIAKITVLGFTYNKSLKAYMVNTNIENKSQETLSYSVSYIIVNGYTLDASASGDIYSKMNSDLNIEFKNEQVKLAGINPISTIKFSIKLKSEESNEILSIVEANLQTSEYGKNYSELNFAGTEAYNKDGIIIKLMPTENPTIKAPLTVYVENNTEQDILLLYNDIAFNNKMVVDSSGGPYILAGTKRVAKMELYYFGQEPEIEKIDSITLSLGIQPFIDYGIYSTGDTLCSKPITITIP